MCAVVPHNLGKGRCAPVASPAMTRLRHRAIAAPLNRIAGSSLPGLGLSRPTGIEPWRNAAFPLRPGEPPSSPETPMASACRWTTHRGVPAFTLRPAATDRYHPYGAPTVPWRNCPAAIYKCCAYRSLVSGNWPPWARSALANIQGVRPALRMDTLTIAERSERMSRIRSKNTKPELIVRSIAHRLGYRFRLHQKDLAGSPDLVFPAIRKAIFVHGCFWHAHEACKVANRPKSRTPYWDDKFKRNKDRDKRNENSLREAGWDVKTIWECETKSPDIVAKRVKAFLGPRKIKRRRNG